MEIKKITEGMTASQVAEVIDSNFRGIREETDAKLSGLGSKQIRRQIDGFLKSDGTVIEVKNTKSTLLEYYCSVGQIYKLKGWFGANAAAVIFYKDNEVISAKSKEKFDYNTLLVVVPKGVNKIIFQSVQYFGVSDSVEMSVEELNASDIYFNSVYPIDGYIKVENGDFTEVKDKTLQTTFLLLPCVEGDVFKYKGRCGGSAEGIIFYDDNYNIVSSTRFDNNLFTEREENVFTPNGATNVLFLSTKGKDSSSRQGKHYFSVQYINENAIEGKLSIKYTKQKGYLRSDDTYSSDSNIFSRTSPIIPCVTGDTFFYKGDGYSMARSYIMYLDGEIVKTGNWSKKDGFATIIIPDGVNQIKFSSFGTSYDDIVFDLYSGDVPNLVSIASSMPKNTILSGKKINWLGDSYVANHKQSKDLTWHSLIAKKYNMVYRNYGINGTKLVGGSTDDMDNRYKDMDLDADYVMIVGGTNDFNSQTPISTFKSQLKTFFMALITTYPSARIAVWTPFNDNDELNPYHGYEDEKIKLGDYAKAMEEVCQSIGLACFNSFNKANIYAWSEEFRTLFFQSSKDMAHLNAEGHKRFSTMAEDFLLSL